MIDTNGPSNPLHKTIVAASGTTTWFSNYEAFPWMMLLPLLGFVGAIGGLLFSTHSPIKGFIATATSLLGIISTVGVSMFQFILLSSTNPSHSLMVWDASSSHLTLFIMLIATVIFMPNILSYTAWVYQVMAGKVTAKDIKQHSHDMY